MAIPVRILFLGWVAGMDGCDLYARLPCALALDPREFTSPLGFEFPLHALLEIRAVDGAYCRILCFCSYVSERTLVLLKYWTSLMDYDVH